jgi:hypothetical protein
MDYRDFPQEFDGVHIYLSKKIGEKLLNESGRRQSISQLLLCDIAKAVVDVHHMLSGEGSELDIVARAVAERHFPIRSTSTLLDPIVAETGLSKRRILEAALEEPAIPHALSAQAPTQDLSDGKHHSDLRRDP